MLGELHQTLLYNENDSYAKWYREKMDQTLTKKVISMRLQTLFPKSFQGDAITFAYFLVNRFSHYKLNKNIPKEV